jgi:hypothetical protein
VLARCGTVSGMFRLVAEDPTVGLDERQAARIRYRLLEFVPALGCRVRLEPTVEIVVTGHYPPDLHPPLLKQIEVIAGCRFQVIVTDD